MNMFTVVLAGLLSAPTAQASEDIDCWVYRGATVHMTGGAAQVTDVVIHNGKVLTLGDDADPPKAGNCETLDARGKHLTPGIISAPSHIGLTEVELEANTRDANAGGDAIRADFRVADAYNPLSSRVAIARNKAVTSAVLFPNGGMVSGQVAWADLAGTHQSEAIAHPSIAMAAQLSGDSRAEGLRVLHELLTEAKQYPKLRGQFERNASRPLLASPSDLEALQAVVSAEIPLVISADRASDIEALIRLVDETRVRLVLSGGAEAWIHADALAKRNISVMLDPLVYGPGGFGQLRARPDNAAILSKAGVNVVIAMNEMMTRSLTQAAGNAVRGGLDADVALSAITQNVAKAFGIPGVGAIVEGYTANLVLWSGDPLEISSAIEHMLIRGQEVSLESRHTKLFDRYLTLPGSPLPPLELPAQEQAEETP